MPVELIEGRRYRATITIRRELGGGIKPGAERLEGRRCVFVAAHEETSQYMYLGEWRMIPEPPDIPFEWIASGDLADIVAL